MELSLVNDSNLDEQYQGGIKGRQSNVDHQGNDLEEQSINTKKSRSRKMTKKQVRENEVAAKAVEMFDPTSTNGKKILNTMLKTNGSVLAKSSWSRHSTLKNYIPLLEPALQHLVDVGLIKLFENGAYVTSNEHRNVPVIVKKIIPPTNAQENLALAKLLKSFDLEHCEYVATWSHIDLSSTTTLTEEVFNFLSSETYSMFIGNIINQWAPRSRVRSTPTTR